MTDANRETLGPVSVRPDAESVERRFLTIVFVDLVGYTPLSEQLDAEELGVLQVRYQQLVLRIMDSYGGFVARFAGDGALVYFGYPRAHERDAERALRAALELQSAIGEIDTEVEGTTLPRLLARIGIHSGQVLMAPESLSMATGIPGAIGEVANIASRLQTEAPPGEIVISQETLELVEGMFDFEALGARQVKGLSRPIPMFRVRRALRDSQNFESRLERGSTRMVGRQDSLARLLAGWKSTLAASSSQCVAVVGEAGVGKTRLLVEFLRLPELLEARHVRATCQEMFSRTPLHPVASLLWAQAELTSESSKEDSQQRVAEFLEGLDLYSAENMETISSLLDLEGRPHNSKGSEPTPQILKNRQYRFVVSVLTKVAEEQPTVLWVEDAHWLDPSSAELLNEILAATSSAPLLVILTLRSARQLPPLAPQVEIIDLRPLANDDGLEVARSVPGAGALDDEMVKQAVLAADGIPLFIEQLVISLLDERIEAIGRRRRASGMPLVLAELLSERLDRMQGGRRIAQAAACIGRPFAADLLVAVLRDDPSIIGNALGALVDAEIVKSERQGDETQYEFRHALLRRMAYESMVQADRRAMHLRIAAVLRNGEKTRLAIPEVLAHHLTEAGLADEAVEAWLNAGVTASRLSAHVEAVDHLRKGLGLIDRIDPPQRRRQLELRLQVSLMSSILATQSATSEALAACCDRGIALCEEGEPSPLIFPFVFGQFTYLNCKGKCVEAEAVARRFLGLAASAANESARVVGHRMLGMALLAQGKPAAAKTELEASLRLYVKERDDPTTFMFGQNTEIHTKSLLSLTQFCLGDVDSSLEIGVNALETADALRHPHSTGIPLIYVGGWVFGLCDAFSDLIRQARRLLALSEQHRLAGFRAHGMAFLGWAMCQRGALTQGIAALEQGIGAFDAVNFHLALAGHLSNLAEAKRKAGRIAEAESAAERSIELLPSGSLWLEPEIRRVHAVVLHQAHPERVSDAVAALIEATRLAQSAGARVLEWRCLKSHRAMVGAESFSPELQVRLEALSGFGDLAQRIARRTEHSAH